MTPLSALSINARNFPSFSGCGSFTNSPGIGMTCGINGLGGSMMESMFAITRCLLYESRAETVQWRKVICMNMAMAIVTT